MKPFKEAEEYSDDLQAAYDYYRAYSSQTAKRFLASYQRAEGILHQSPYICRQR
jgi:hypothetical protein